ncbi:swirm domain-containing protein [Zymoseptoria brevis]|uniref:Swirm domain-containing protein n=1 Tax=Zymoseptoria brevis TaxID=1047168 RepID=A0A0F4GLC3_9PEZI|nr:swirm domain-containing protein [Zymoseptoria brevis]
MEATTSSNTNKRSTTMGPAHLMTPESPLLDSFNTIAAVVQPKHQPSVPSPPASPTLNSFAGQYDQQLYPDNNNTSAASTLPPLFGADQNQGWASRHQTPPTERSLSIAAPPSQHDSPLQDITHPARKSTSPATGPVALYNTFGNEYYQLMLSQMEGHRERMINNRTLPTPEASHPDRDIYDRSVLRSLGRPSRVEKARTTGRLVTKTKPAKPTSTRTAPTRAIVPASESPSNIPPLTVVRETPARRIRKRAATPDVDGPSGASKRTRAAPSKKLDGKPPSQWAELEDFCPPISSLDRMEQEELNVNWTNSSALNLDNDPDRLHLHPQELKVASKLRLHGNEYLLNKRRIFAAKLKSLQEGTAFNKTSAQNATSVDVNKASRLWSAFDSVGWFDEAWFKQWL